MKHRPDNAPSLIGRALRKMRWLVAGLTCLVALPACSGSSQAEAPSAPPTDPNAPVLLTIEGYNYTDRYIDSFTVNGQGGGNLFVSSPTSGGGKGACCVSWRPGSHLPRKIRIRWVGAYCKYQLRSSAGELHMATQPLWREADAVLNGPIPQNPKNFEVHIYKDGHVEVAITADLSEPRLKLPSSDELPIRPGITFHDPVCTDEQRR